MNKFEFITKIIDSVLGGLTKPIIGLFTRKNDQSFIVQLVAIVALFIVAMTIIIEFS